VTEDRGASGGVLLHLWSRWRRSLISLFIFALLYQNVAGMLGIWQVRLARSTLPNVTLLSNLFYMYGVFGSITTHAKRYAAYGSRERLAQPPHEPLFHMTDLDIYRYFPQRRGEAHRRLGLTSYRWQPERRVAGYRSLSDTIQRHHNRAHPEAPVAQVFVYVYEWPLDERGYDAREFEKTVRLVGHN
jgi:hypothetical protein